MKVLIWTLELGVTLKNVLLLDDDLMLKLKMDEKDVLKREVLV